MPGRVEPQDLHSSPSRQTKTYHERIMSRTDTATSSSRRTPVPHDWRAAYVTSGELNNILESNSREITPLLIGLDTGVTTLESKTDKLQECVKTLDKKTDKLQECVTTQDKKTNARLDGIEVRMGGIEMRIGDLTNLTINGRLTRLTDAIMPIYPPGTRKLPRKMPRTVGNLFKLELIDNHEKLAELLVAYQVEGWRYWRRTESESYADHFLNNDTDYDNDNDDGGDDTDDDGSGSEQDPDSSSGSSERRYSSALQAVQHHPHRALEGLASRLGLDFQRLYAHQRTIRAQTHPRSAIKRQGESLREENVKRIPSVNPTQQVPPQPGSSHYTPDGHTFIETVGWAHESPPSGRLIKRVKDCAKPLIEYPSDTSDVPFRPITYGGGKTTVADDSE